MPGELLPVSPLVERLQQRDAAVDRRLGVEEEHPGEDLVGAVGGGEVLGGGGGEGGGR